jgi:hypothetical protein
MKASSFVLMVAIASAWALLLFVNAFIKRMMRNTIVAASRM